MSFRGVNGSAAAAALIIGILLGSLAGVITSISPSDDGLATSETPEASTEQQTDQASSRPLETPGDVAQPASTQPATSTTEPPPTTQPEPVELDTVAVANLQSRVLGAEAVGCGGAMHFTTFTTAQGNLVPADVGSHSWLITHFDGQTGAEYSQSPFRPMRSVNGEFGYSDSLGPAPLTPATYDAVVGQDVAVLGFDYQVLEVKTITGTVTNVSPNTLTVQFDRTLPLSAIGAPVVGGTGELLGAIGRNNAVIRLDGLAPGSQAPDADCRNATHQLLPSQYARAISNKTQEILLAQYFVDVLAGEDWDIARSMDVERRTASDAQWRDGWGLLQQGWLVPLYDTAPPGRWRFGYHTFEGRMDFLPSGKTRDNDLYPGFSNVNRLFCITWDINTSAGTVNQGVDVSNRRPQSSEVFDAPASSRRIWTRVDQSHPVGTVDTNELVIDFQQQC